MNWEDTEHSTAEEVEAQVREAMELLSQADLDDTVCGRLLDLADSLQRNLRCVCRDTSLDLSLHLLCALLFASAPSVEFACRVVSATDNCIPSTVAPVAFGHYPAEKWVDGLHSKSFAETLLVLMTARSEEPAVIECAERVAVLILRLLPSFDGVKLANATSVLCEYVEKCTEENWQCRFKPMLAQTVLTRLLTSLSNLSGAQACAVMRVATTVLSSPLVPLLLSNPQREELAKLCIRTLPALTVALEHVPDSKLETQFGESFPCLGALRLAAVKLLRAFVALSCNSLSLAVLRSGALRLATDLFFAYEWHSFLHREYYCLVSTLLAAPSDVQLRLLEDTGLPEHIVATELKGLRGGKEIRLGHIGYVIRISELISKAAQTSLLLHATLMEVQGWENFVRLTLEPMLAEESSAERSMTSIHSSPGASTFLATMVDEVSNLPPLATCLHSESDDEDDGCDFELKEDPPASPL